MRYLIVAAALTAVFGSSAAMAQSAPPPAPKPGPVNKPAPRYVPPQRGIALNQDGVCEAWTIRIADPGLDCIDPGQLGQRYKVGQILNDRRVGFTPYPEIPYGVRHALNLTRDGRYIYHPGFLYAVDPKTRTVTDIVRVLER